jgi:hypothetical protein
VVLRALLLALVVLASGTATAQAACSDTWTGGAGDGQWSNPGNWSSGAPIGTDDVCLGSGANTVVIDATHNNINGLTVAAGDTLAIQGAPSASLVVGPAGTDNSGTISLNVSAGEAVLENTGTLTNEVGAEVTTAGSAGYGAYLEGNIVNYGTFTLDAGSTVYGPGDVADPFTSNAPAGRFQNGLMQNGLAVQAGVIDVGTATSFDQLLLSGSNDLENEAGTIVAGQNSPNLITNEVLLEGGAAYPDNSAFASSSNEYVQGDGTVTGTYIYMSGPAPFASYTGTGTSVVQLTGTASVVGGIIPSTAELYVLSGTASVGGTVNRGTILVAGATLSGASLENDGTLETIGAPVSTLAVPITNDLGAVFEASGDTTLTGGPLRNDGLLVLPGQSGAYTLNASAINVDNTGQVVLDHDAAMSAAAFNQTSAGGSLAFNDPTAQLTAAGGVNISGGLVSGDGDIDANVNNTGGTVVDGIEPGGMLSITGNYTQGSGGTLSATIAGGGPAGLSVSGTVSLAGTLSASMSSTPATYTLITDPTSGSISGTFSTTQVTGLGGSGYQLFYTTSTVPSTVQLQVIANPVSNPALAVGPSSVPAGENVVQEANIPLQPLGADAQAIQSLPAHSGPAHSGPAHSGPAHSGPAHSGPAHSGPAHSGPLESLPAHSGPAHSGPAHSGPVHSIELASVITLNDVPISDSTGANPQLSWPWVLQGTKYATVPLQNVTLQDVFNLAEGSSPPQPFLGRYDAVTPADMDITGTPLANLSLSAWFLGGLPLADIPAPKGDWCSFLSAQPYHCPASGQASWLAGTELADLEYHGDHDTAALSSPVALAPSTATSDGGADAVLEDASGNEALIGEIAMESVQWWATPYADLTVDGLASAGLLSCTGSSGNSPNICKQGLTLDDIFEGVGTGDYLPYVGDYLSTTVNGTTRLTTIEDLAAAIQASAGLPMAAPAGNPNATPPSNTLDALTLSGLLPGVIDADAANVEDADAAAFQAVLGAADVRAGNDVTATAVANYNCAAVSNPSVSFTVPVGFQYVPGSATLQNTPHNGDISAPVQTGDTYTFSSETAALTDPPFGICEGDTGEENGVALSASFEPAATLGQTSSGITASIGASGANTNLTGGPGSFDVTQPSNEASSSPSSPIQMTAGNLYTGHVTSPRQRVYYSLPIPSDAPVGEQITFSLSHETNDDDLVVYGPTAGIPSVSFRSTVAQAPARSGLPQDNASPESSQQQEPNAVQDVPMPDISGMSVLGVSDYPGTATDTVTVVVSEGMAGQTLLAQVDGFNGTTSPSPFLVRATVTNPEPAPACETPPSGLNQLPTGYTALKWPSSIPASTQTLYLIDDVRMANLYGGPSKIGPLLTELQSVAQASNGVVVPVESDPSSGHGSSASVNAAYAQWDGSPCNITGADNVVADINAVIDDARQGITNLKNIVVIGGDEAIPQARLADLTDPSLNEGGHAGEITPVSGGEPFDTPVTRALRDSFFLSDDPYGAFHPRLAFGTDAFVPEVALGRLVETPAEILGQLQQFISSSGQLDPSTAAVSGYDFFATGAQQEATDLSGLLGAGNVSSLIASGPSSAWSGQQLSSALNGSKPAIIAPNAHYDETLAEPAGYYYGSSNDSLLDDSTIAPVAGDIVFTMGCHAGLELDPGEIGGGTSWTELFGSSNDEFIANTGYGIGDSDMIAYSVRLLDDFAGNIGPSMNIGQALMFAKQTYAAQGSVQGSIPPIDAKALQELTFYGMPNYVIGTSGTSAPSVVQPPPSTVTPTAPDPQDLTVSNIDNVAVSAPSGTGIGNGTYYQVHGFATSFGTSVTDDSNDSIHEAPYPIEPDALIDVTSSTGEPAHGFLVTSLSSQDTSPFTPVYDQAQTGSGSAVPLAPPNPATFFPSNIAGVSKELTPHGPKYLLQLATGQFFSPAPTQRLFSSIGGSVEYSPSSDYAPPTIGQVSATTSGSQATFSVTTPDSDVIRAEILYELTQSGPWYTDEISGPAGTTTFANSVDLPGGGTSLFEYIVQLLDTSGNVAITTNKGPGYGAAPSSTGPAPSLRLSFASRHDGYYTAPVTVTLKNAVDPSAWSYTVNGSALKPYDPSNPPTFGSDGGYTIVFSDAQQSLPPVYLPIQITPPTISQQVLNASGSQVKPTSAGWYSAASSALHVSFVCTDAFSGFPVGGCPADVPLSANAANQPVSGTATDRAGLTSQPSSATYNVDSTPPSGSINAAGLTLTIDVGRGQALTGTAADSLSGIGGVSVNWKNAAGATTSIPATVTCTNSSDHSCTWGDAPPKTLLGIYTVTATITDRAGNTSTATSSATIILVNI